MEVSYWLLGHLSKDHREFQATRKRNIGWSRKTPSRGGTAKYAYTLKWKEEDVLSTISFSPSLHNLRTVALSRVVNPGTPAPYKQPTRTYARYRTASRLDGVLFLNEAVRPNYTTKLSVSGDYLNLEPNERNVCVPDFNHQSPPPRSLWKEINSYSIHEHMWTAYIK